MAARIRLQEQPFQILAYLLDRAGEVVTREELRAEVMARRHFRGFRPQPEYRDQQTAGGAGRLGLEPALCRNPGAARISLPGSPANGGGESAGLSGSTARDRPRSAVPAAFHPELEVPLPRRSLTRGLFGLIQVMYLIFYVSALFRLSGIERSHERVFAGVGIARYLHRRAGDGGRGYPPALLSDLGGGLRSPRTGSKISADIPTDTGS